ncbi:hypothetical protein JTB14_036893 [Gonioctena quinquepunctata]|nr:hypothetical protein JTB14_036893 [Gonioctena quinquepunctata]
MDIEGHKEEPPDGDKSGGSEISQVGKKEWPPPIGDVQKQEAKFELGQNDLSDGQGNDSVHSHEIQKEMPSPIENDPIQGIKFEWGQTDQMPRYGNESMYSYGIQKEYCPYPKRMSQLKKSSTSWDKLNTCSDLGKTRM